jgi:hypothetical protein
MKKIIFVFGFIALFINYSCTNNNRSASKKRPEYVLVVHGRAGTIYK